MRKNIVPMFPSVASYWESRLGRPLSLAQIQSLEDEAATKQSEAYWKKVFAEKKREEQEKKGPDKP